MADLSIYMLKWYSLARKGYPRAALSLLDEFAGLLEVGDLSPAQRALLAGALRRIASNGDAGAAFSERPACQPKLEGGLPLEKLGRGLDVFPVYEALVGVSTLHRIARMLRGDVRPSAQERAALKAGTLPGAWRRARRVARGAGVQTIKDWIATAVDAYDQHREASRLED